MQEGSGIPSLFDTERAAKRCAKELWPRSNWAIKPKSYIKAGEKKRDKKEKEWQDQVGSTLSAGTNLIFRFTDFTNSKPYLVFQYEKPKVSEKAVYRASTEARAVAYAEKLAKTFISVRHPNRAIWIARFKIDNDNPTPGWVTSYELDADTQFKLRTKLNKVTLNREDHQVNGLEQPIPKLSVDDKWVCPVTGKVYEKLTKRIFTNILKFIKDHPDKYMDIHLWKAFNYGSGWICPYSGKLFKKSGKRLNTHLVKQRELFTKGKIL